MPFLECELREFFFTQEDTVLEFVSLQVYGTACFLVGKDIGVCRRLHELDLLLVWGLDIGSVVTSASRWKLEAVDGEWKISIIWIIDKESVVD